jgi:hypothetical protein
MGKAERNRQQAARQRIAMQQEAARRAENMRRALIAGGSALLVVVIVVVLVVIKSLNHTSPPSTTASTATSNAAVATQVTSVPETVLDKVGAGPSSVVPLKPISGPALTLGGKPEMLYVGEESCPFCAAERWAMTVALSRFGTFSNLHFIHSSPDDVYSNTSTLTFYKSSYSSNYLNFVPVESRTVAGETLQQPTAAQTALLDKYTGGTFPFVDIDGKYIVNGAQYLPSVLGSVETEDSSHFGLTWAEIGADLQNPNSPVAQSIIGAANHIAAAICKVTNGQPGSVCKSTSVTSVGGSI